MKTKKELKIELIQCKYEKELIKSWTNCTNYNECQRSIKYLDGLIEILEFNLEMGVYLDE